MQACTVKIVSTIECEMSMGHLSKLLCAFGLIVVSSAIQAADINIMSWNAKRLGQGNSQSFAVLGAIAARADIVAVQEVMTEKGLNSLEAAIERASGERWERIESHMIGSDGYKEAYAFIWRATAVEYVDGAVTFMDRGNRFIREPYSARFASRADGSQFIAATIHILYGNRAEDRTPEIKALGEYWQWLGEVYEETPIILMGDFNLAPSDPAWAHLKQYAKPLITRGATTLSSINGRYANLYDNFWVSKNTTLPIRKSGIVDYPRMVGWNHEKSRAHVSDHAPIYLSLGSAQMDLSAFASKKFSQTTPLKATQSAAGAVRGNRNSRIYHRANCPSYSMVSERNRVEFSSAKEAETADYRKAGNCSQ